MDNMSRCRITILERIQSIAREAEASGEHILARAGTTKPQLPPHGMGVIVAKGGSGSLGFSGGLTPIKHSGSFTTPVFMTKTSAVRKGYVVQHFAEVLPTSAQDIEHDSFYPDAGDHLRPGMTQTINKITYNHYWRITPEISSLIRQGEEEHLADAARAFELTYKLIADTINGMIGTKFGPNGTPGAATQTAEAELARKLPNVLGPDPANWAKVLDRLLDQTLVRDNSGWHSLVTAPETTEGDKIVHLVTVTSTTRVGQVASSQVVNY
jgi:hypothetical protein